jgi:DNA-binding beta-propeller fold protein YncE
LLRILTLAGLLVAGSAIAAPGYRLSATLPLNAPAPTGGMAVDAKTQRLFIANGPGITAVSLGGKPAIAGTVAGLVDARGVALVPGGFGYAAGGQGGGVVVFDKPALVKLRTVPTGASSDAVVYDPSSTNIFAMNQDGGAVSVVTTGMDSVIATLQVGGKLAGAAADGQGNLFVNQADTATILRISATTNMVTARWRLAGCERPGALVFDAADRRVFSACGNARLAVVNAASGRVAAQTHLALACGALAFDGARRRLFCAGTDGTISVLDAATLHTITALPLAGVRAMAIDAATGALLAVSAAGGDDAVSVFVPQG